MNSAKLKAIQIFVTCLLALTGCIHDPNNKAHSSAFDATTLSIPHTYTTPDYVPSKYPSQEWWTRFHDKQLNQLIITALADSPDMHIAEARIRKAQQLTKVAESYFWPSIESSGYIQRKRFSEFGLVPPPFNGHTYNIGELGLNFNYEFDFWGKNRQLVAAKVSEECASKADLAESRLILSAAVANAYFQLQSNTTLLNIAKATLNQRKKIVTIVQYRAQHGIESDIPVQTALTEMQSAKLTVDQFQEAQNISHHQLSVLLGKNPLVTTIETEKLNHQLYYVEIPKSLPANLLGQRPDIIASRLRAEATAHQINVAKTRFLPNINLNGLFSFESIGLNRLFQRESQTNGITGAIDLPIFDAGARRANVGVRYAEYDEAVSEYNRLVLSALQDVADQLATLSSLKKQLSAQQNVLTATRRYYKLVNSRYHHGIIDYLQVLDAEGSLLQQRAIEIDLQTRHLQAVVAMMKALGGSGFEAWRQP